ncbi:MAG: type II toxin-antitoxin system VapC family toxin [Phormidesmis sp.]
MIVVDTNIIVYLYINGEGSHQAEALLSQDSAWVAPILWLSEFRNVLSLYLRKEWMSLNQALSVLKLAEALLGNGQYQVSSVEVMQLASASSCSAYDCEFVALAQQLDINLVTNDRKLLKAFPDTAISLDAYVS